MSKETEMTEDFIRNYVWCGECQRNVKIKSLSYDQDHGQVVEILSCGHINNQPVETDYSQLQPLDPKNPEYVPET